MSTLDHTLEPKATAVRRLEVITGAGLGAVASEVARRHEITPQHLFAWRKAARAGRLTLPAEEAPMFVPVVTTTHEVGAAGALANRPGSIVIEIAGAVVRADPLVRANCLRR